eukprot:365022-Chlamydomonas_euryale.AAC.3
MPRPIAAGYAEPSKTGWLPRVGCHIRAPAFFSRPPCASIPAPGTSLVWQGNRSLTRKWHKTCRATHCNAQQRRMLTAPEAACVLTASEAACVLTASVAACALTAPEAACVLTASKAACLLTASEAACVRKKPSRQDRPTRTKTTPAMADQCPLWAQHSTYPPQPQLDVKLLPHKTMPPTAPTCSTAPTCPTTPTCPTAVALTSAWACSMSLRRSGSF